MDGTFYYNYNFFYHSSKHVMHYDYYEFYISCYKDDFFFFFDLSLTQDNLHGLRGNL